MPDRMIPHSVTPTWVFYSPVYRTLNDNIVAFQSFELDFVQDEAVQRCIMVPKYCIKCFVHYSCLPRSALWTHV